MIKTIIQTFGMHCTYLLLQWGSRVLNRLPNKLRRVVTAFMHFMTMEFYKLMVFGEQFFYDNRTRLPILI